MNVSNAGATIKDNQLVAVKEGPGKVSAEVLVTRGLSTRGTTASGRAHPNLPRQRPRPIAVSEHYALARLLSKRPYSRNVCVTKLGLSALIVCAYAIVSVSPIIAFLPFRMSQLRAQQ